MPTVLVTGPTVV